MIRGTFEKHSHREGDLIAPMLKAGISVAAINRDGEQEIRPSLLRAVEMDDLPTVVGFLDRVEERRVKFVELHSLSILHPSALPNVEKHKCQPLDSFGESR